MPPKKINRTEGSAAGPLSLNPVFACTGPHAGVLSAAGGRKLLDELLDVVDDSVLQAVEDALETVGVPAADYWSARLWQSMGAPAVKTAASVKNYGMAMKIPDPTSIAGSFYGSRLEALRGRGFTTGSDMLVVAVDRRLGNGSKLFNVLSRSSCADSRGFEYHLGGVAGESGQGAERLIADAPRADPLQCSAVAAFVNAIPRPYDRCVYALIDENAPVDPYFDIDCSYTAPALSCSGNSECAFAHAFPWWARDSATAGGDLHRQPPVASLQIEKLLFEILHFLSAYLERHLHTTVAECLVLTSSVQVSREENASGGTKVLAELKLSFHVHMRFHNHTAIENVRAMHEIMSKLRERLDAVLSAAASGSEQALPQETVEFFEGTVPPSQTLSALAAIVRKCVDFGVYSRWRALRLPYCVKTPFATAAGAAAVFTPVDAAVDDLLTAQVAQSGVVAQMPDCTVGSCANSIMQSLVLHAPSSAHREEARLLGKMSYLFRFFLPVAAGETPLSFAPLREFLERYAPHVAADHSAASPTAVDSRRKRFAAAVMELACVQRHNPSRHGGEQDPAPLHLLRAPVDASSEQPPAAAQDGSASSLQKRRPPMPHGSRVPVAERETLDLLAEVFACLAPQYAAAASTPPGRADPASFALSAGSTEPNACRPVTWSCVSAQYEESIRAFYVIQKQSRYCVKQGRTHRSTYAQLYLTYGSIKVRCYSNDCCERCLFIPWTKPTGPVEGVFAPGYPRYERLTEIRDTLFPSLPTEELVRRYGPQVLAELDVQPESIAA